MRLTVDDQGWKKVLLLKDGRFLIATYESLEHASRAAALWNAAEDIGSTTSEIEEGVIQFAFELGERHAEVINAAKERIEKLEAENAVMLEVLEFANSRLICGDGDCYCMEFNLDEYLRILAAIRKAGGGARSDNDRNGFAQCSDTQKNTGLRQSLQRRVQILEQLRGGRLLHPARSGVRCTAE